MRQQKFEGIVSMPGPVELGRRLFCKWLAWFSFAGATVPFFARAASGAGADRVVVATTEELASAWSFREFTFVKEVETRGQRAASEFPGIAIRLPDGSFYVASLVCPHEGCLIEFEEPLLTCPCHRSAFDPVQDGKVLSGSAPRPPWKFNFIIEKGKIVVHGLEPGAEMRVR